MKPSADVEDGDELTEVEAQNVSRDDHIEVIETTRV